MKKMIASLMLVGTVAFVSAQTPQTTKSETKQMHAEHKKTTTTTINPGAKMSTTKKHHGWKKGKHNGTIKETKTTTTTTVNP
ncbi:MAG TPA: hypothetical protein VLJ41_07380 [Segetibacter sp.]|nr:hypothetical protein [Segetibacter sp.]